MRCLILLMMLPLLTSCGNLIAVGTTGSQGASTYKTISYAKTGIDVLSYHETGQTTTEKVLSKAIGKDCVIFRVLDGKQVCQKTNNKKEKQ